MLSLTYSIIQVIHVLYIYYRWSGRWLQHMVGQLDYFMLCWSSCFIYCMRDRQYFLTFGWAFGQEMPFLQIIPYPAIIQSYEQGRTSISGFMVVSVVYKVSGSHFNLIDELSLSTPLKKEGDILNSIILLSVDG